MANASSNMSCLETSIATTVVLPTLYFFILITGLPGNALSLWIFLKKIKLKTPTHFYLTNLVVSNLLFCMIIPFLFLYYAKGYSWKTDMVICQFTVGIVTPILYININISIVLLSWIAISRYAILIKHNKKTCYCYPSVLRRLFLSGFLKGFRQLKFAKILCLSVWIIVVGGTVPLAAYYSITEVGVENIEACYGKQVETGGKTSQLGSLFAISLSFICFLVVFVLYLSIARHVYNIQKSAAIPGRHRVYNKVFRNVLVIQVVLFVCFLPHNIFKAVFVSLVGTCACDKLTTLVEVKNILLCLTAFRSSLDPLTYFLLDKTFRRHFHNALASSQTAQPSNSQITVQVTKCIETPKGEQPLQFRHRTMETQMHTSESFVQYSTSVLSSSKWDSVHRLQICTCE
ncbi:putative G-protein coupled receptor 82 [Acipenser ruthenus]|uniref:Putative G-protein coupled receptor 82 n=1 Tax=Acipenser ruthenus TaxID=7906 RepID=A0A444U911_ACIRT|nr:putative G-protein coupled receptor 82 [Acipenser ruthenus]